MRVPSEFVILKVQTTDIDQWYQQNVPPQIIELAAILVSGNKKQSQISSVICPDSLDFFTTSCVTSTGISQEDLEKAPRFVEFYKNFQQFTKFQKYPILSFTSFYETLVLQAEYNRLKLKFPHRIPFLDLHTILEINAYKYSASKTLAGICESLGITVPKQRRAIQSCEIYLEIVQRMLEADERMDDKVEIYSF